jgi:nicotinamide-nucleotide amidase
METAAIITIGDELLIGQVIDTNSAWLAQELNKIGIKVTSRLAVGDNKKDIETALDSLSNNKLIIMTGGLGPTADDITKPFLLEYFGGEMITHQPTLDHITRLWNEVFKKELTERNIKQADVPSSCRVLLNTAGSAPGMWFERNNCIYISLPGVPFEMKTIMQEYGFDEIRKAVNQENILHRTLQTFGIGESVIADRLETFESSLPEFLQLAYLPNYGLVRLRLSGMHKDRKVLVAAMDQHFAALKELLADVMISDEDLPMEKILLDLLQNKNAHMAAAESCTGGYIAHLMTTLPGSSAVFEGSTVTYSNEMKKKMLGVSEGTLLKFGAVSEEVVIEMVEGLLKLTGADFGIAVSGIMGPDGGSPEKPVGTVWMAAGSTDAVITHKFHFRFGRRQNIEVTAMNALNFLRKFILSVD